MSEHAAHGGADAELTAKLGLWLFLATEVLLFGALFTAYTVFRLKHPELFHEEALKLNRSLGALNTVVLIASSLTVALGIAALKGGRRKSFIGFYTTSIALASVFLCVKYFEYAEHIHAGELPGTNIFFSLYYSLTALHALHVFAGMVALGAMVIMALRGTLGAERNMPAEIAGIYWHFVDLVWIYLFPLLYLIG